MPAAERPLIDYNFCVTGIHNKEIEDDRSGVLL